MTTTNFIDPSLHIATFPATYVPPGLLANLGVSAGGTVATSSYTTASTMTSGPYSGNTGVVIPGNVIQGPDADHISGNFTGAGNIVVIPVGFFPSNIEIIDWTGVIKWQWMAGAPATDTLKVVTAGTETADTTTGISVVADKAGGSGDVCYVVLTAALAVSTHVISFRVEQ